MTYDELCAEVAALMVDYIELLEITQEIDESPIIFMHNLYLVASMAHYKYNFSILSGSNYALICKHLENNYESAKAVVRRPSKTLKLRQLRSGSGYDLEYSGIIFNIYLAVRRQLYRKGKQS